MSGGNTVTYEFMMQNQQAIMNAFSSINNAMDAQARKITQLNQQNRKHVQQQKRDWQGIVGSITTGARQLLGFGSGLAGILTAVQMVRAEWDKIIAAQKKSEEMRTGAALPFQAMNIMFAKDEPGTKNGIFTPEQMRKLNRDVGKKTFLTQAEQNDVAAEILSARGERSIRDAFGFQEVAGRLAPGNPEAQKALGVRALDISRASGEKDPEKVIASLMQAVQTSRITDMTKFSENVVNPILAGTMTGDTFEESAERFSQLTLGGADASGELSRTAFIRMTEEMKKFIPQRTMPGSGGKTHRFSKAEIDEINRAQSAGFNDFLDLTARNKKVADAFIQQGGSFGKGAMSPITHAIIRGETIVTPDGRGFDPQAVLGGVRQRLGPMGNQQALDLLHEKQGVIAADPANQSFMAGRVKTINQENAALDKIQSGNILTNQIREAFTEAIKDHNVSGADWLEDTPTIAEFNAMVAMGRDPAQTARNLLARTRMFSAGDTPEARMAEAAKIDAAVQAINEQERIYRPDGGERPMRGKNAVGNNRGNRRGD